MNGTRRAVLWRGASLLAAAALPLRATAAGAAVIEMRGTPRGEHVWFAPAGLAIEPGGTVRFVNRDPGNTHTATAYHPDLGRQLRIPPDAAPWDSGLLMPDAAFAVTLSVPGIYDLYCQPHEAAGMVARIVVGRPDGGAGWAVAPDTGDLPAAALAGFPPVETILAHGSVTPAAARLAPGADHGIVPAHPPHGDRAARSLTRRYPRAISSPG